MLKLLWRRVVADRLIDSLRHRLNTTALEAQAAEGARAQRDAAARIQALEAEVARLAAEVGTHLTGHDDGFGRRNFFVPDLAIHPLSDHPFMTESSCSAKDFFHPDFARICANLDLRPSHHRKIWEYVFIVHHLERFNLLREGVRGVGFGVGVEPLPSVFAKRGASITATDAPAEVIEGVGWTDTAQHVSAHDQVHYPTIVDRETFDARVSFQPCDMRAIDPALKDFDFCWSSCCFEHLGDLRAGLDFVRESVEKTLKIGGVACHTTELNLSSNTHTVDTGVTVLYRKRDLEEFAEEMRARGHHVEPFRVAPDSHWLDLHIDVPPYSQDPHLKIELMGYKTTSAGLVITRGR